MDSLLARFNGDENHDIAILRDYLSKLERIDENIPIIKAIGNFCAERFPNADFVKAAKKIEEAFDDFKQKMDKAQTFMKNKDYPNAVAAFREIIGNVAPESENGKLKFAFGHPFEEMIYRMNFKEEGKIERISELPVLIYMQLGSALFEMQNYGEAKTAYEDALKLNPVNLFVWFELIQIAKLQKDYQGMRAILGKIHPYIFTRHFLARFYREYAFLAMLDGLYDLCVALTYLSMDYEDDQHARAQLNAVAKKPGVNLNKPTVEAVKKILSENQIPIGPARAVYENAFQIGQQTKNAYPQVAKMALGIAYDLTHYQPLLKEIERL